MDVLRINVSLQPEDGWLRLRTAVGSTCRERVGYSRKFPLAEFDSNFAQIWDQIGHEIKSYANEVGHVG